MRKKRLQKIVALLMVVAMVLNLTPSGLTVSLADEPEPAATGTTTAGEAELADGEKYADVDRTTEYLTTLGNNDSTQYTGRIWTDKSVFTGSKTFTVEGSGTSQDIPVTTDTENGEDFLVAYSALSTSLSVTGEAETPIDVVFILDISGSMRYTMDGSQTASTLSASRIYAAVTALNAAIDSLMTMNNSNRVAVVAYSSTAQTILPLDHYTSTSNDKTYLSTSRIGNGINASFSVKLCATNSSKTNLTTSYTVSGATNIQHGLYTGMNLLASAASTTVTLEDGSTVTRMPFTVLLSDGQPTYSSSSSSWWAPSAATQGPGDASYYGNGMLAMMTASYMKAAINRNYGLSSTASNATKLYTVGVGISGLTGNDLNLANIVLNPSAYWNADNTIASSIRTAWASYITKGTDGNYGTPSISVNRNSTYTLKHPTTNDVTSISDYVNAYYAADSASSLSDAFKNIVSEISVSTATVPTKITESGVTASGYIRYTDPIGEYMEVKDVTGILYDGVLYTAKTVTAVDANTVRYTFTDSVTSPIYGQQSLSDINITVYTDADGNQTIYINIPASVIPVRVNSVSLGEDTNGNTIVTSHTSDDIYPIRVLYSVGLSSSVDRDTLEGVSDAYIAANSNSDGSVNFYANLYTGQKASEVDNNGTVTTDGTVGNATTQFYPATSNRFYYVQNDNLLYTDENCTIPATSFSETGTYYYQLTHYEGTTIVTTTEKRSGTVLSHETVYKNETDGYYYIAKGSGRLGYLQDFETSKADTTTTATADYYYYPTYDGVPTSDTYGQVTNYLGNNGVMALGGTGSLTVSKTVTADEGLTAPEKSFTFTVSLTDASGTALTDSYSYTVVDASGNTVSTGTIANGGTVSLSNGQEMTITDLPATTKYSVTETAVAGFTPSASGETVSSNNLTVSGQIVYVGEDDTAAFTNHYSVTPVTLAGSAKLAGSKILKNRNWTSSDSYTFVIESERENIPMPTDGAGNIVTEVTVTASDADTNGVATFAFEDITYTTPGTYVYYIYEKSVADSAGMTYSKARYKVTVTVEDTGSGTLSVSSTMVQTYTDDNTLNSNPPTVASADFTNTYSADNITWYPTGIKLYTDYSGGNPLTNDMFTFELRPTGDNAADAPMPADATGEGPDRVATVRNEVGEVVFGGITLTQAMVGRTYTYEVTEVVPTGGTDNNDGTYTLNGMTYSLSKQTITLTVSQAANGELQRTVVYSSGDGFSFTNSYDPEDAKATIQGSKTLTGRAMHEDESFSFTLTASNTLAQTVFGDDYTRTATASGGADGAAVSFDFGEMTFPQVGTYEFTVTEKEEGTADGVTYDANVATVTVTVTDTNGVLSASVSYENSLHSSDTSKAVFENTYQATFDTSTAVNLNVTKQLTGKALDTNAFYIVVTPVNSAPMGSTLTYTGTTASWIAGSTTSDGYNVYSSTFAVLKNITYTEAGTYEYTVTEHIPDPQATGMTYDTSEYRVTVTVTDDGDGRLYVADGNVVIEEKGANGSYSKVSSIVFSNVYKPLSTTAAAPVTTKVLEGDRNEGLKAGEFTFELTVTPDSISPSDGYTLPSVTKVTNAADGTVTFGDITFTKPGTYTVTVKEVAGSDSYMDYDLTEKYITYSVVDNNGQLEVRVLDQSADLEFVNTYNTTVTVKGDTYLTVTKDFTGRDNDEWLTTDSFTFYLIARGDVTQKAIDDGYVTLPANASSGITITSTSTNYSEAFGDIVITKPGTYNFAVYEDGSNGIAGVEYDTANRIVTVVATDKGDGTMSIDVSYSIVTDSATGDTETVDDLTFKNVYKTGETVLDGEAYLKVKKTFTGRENNAWLESDSFTFTISAGDAETEAAVTAGAITLPSDVKVTVLNNQIAHFDGITFENTDSYTVATTAGKVYTFTVEEVIPAEATDANNYTVNGLTYDTSEKTVYVAVTDNGDGTLTATLLDGTDNSFTAASGSPLESDELSFTNTYSADEVTTEGKLDMTVTKKIEGRNWIASDSYEFFLATNDTDTQEAITNGDVELADTSVTITKDMADHSATFGAITFYKAGTYKFVIGETPGSIDNMEYDTHTVTFTVVVEDNNEGKLVVTGVYDSDNNIEITGSLTFTNTFNPAPITVTGTKTWIDGGKTHDNATEITLTLKRKVASETEYTVVSGVTATWDGDTYTFSNLEQFNLDAEEYTYIVEETAVSGYTTEYDADHLNITNRLIPDDDKTSKDAGGLVIDGQMVTAGQELTYEIKWTNAIRDKVTGNVTSTYSDKVTIVDTIPAGLVVDETSITAGGVYDASEGTITWSFTGLATDDIAQGTVSFKATVASDAASEAELKNTATIAETNVTVETDNYVPVKTVEVSDTDGDDEARVGKELTYTVTFKNTEDAETTVKITDTLDSTLTYKANSATGVAGTLTVKDVSGNNVTCDVTFTHNGQELTWEIKNVPAGATGEVSFTATINENAEGLTINNQATVEVGGHKADTNTVPVTVVDPGRYVVSGTKTLVGRAMKASDSFSFKLEAYDKATKDAVAAETVVIGDTLKAESETITVTGASAANSDKTGEVTFTFGAVSFSQEGTYKFKVTEVIPADADKIENVTYDGSYYIITVTVADNGSGEMEVTGVTIADNTGAEADVSFTNTWYDESEAKSVTEETDDGNGNLVTANIDGQLVGLHDVLTYTIDWVNTAVDANGVPAKATIIIEDTIPTGTNYVAGTALGDAIVIGSGSGTATVKVDYDETNEKLTWTIEAEPAAYGSVSFDVIVAEDAFVSATTKITNEATVTDGTNSYTTNQTTNYVPVKTGEVQDSDSSVLKVGDIVTYSIEFTNTADTAENSISVVDTLATGLVYKTGTATVSVNGGTATSAEPTADGQKLTWSLKDIAQGAAVVISFDVEVTEDADAHVTNQAIVDGHKSNVDVTPVPAEDEKHVLNEDDVFIDGEAVSAGQILYYEISWTNEIDNGDGTTSYAGTVTIVDKLPDGVTLLTRDGGSYDATAGINGTLTWEKTGLSTTQMERGTIIFSVQVDGDEAYIENTALITANSYEKTATVFNTVPTKEVYEADTTINANGKVVNVGDELTYVVSYTNDAVDANGNPKASNIWISDAAPAGTAYVSGSADFTVIAEDGTDLTAAFKASTATVFDVTAAGVIDSYFDEVPAGATVTVTFNVTVTKDALKLAGNAVSNQAEVTIDENPVVTAEVVTRVVDKEVGFAEDPTVSIDGQTVGVGSELTYTIDWVNYATDENGNATEATVVVKDEIPAGTVFVMGSDTDISSITGASVKYYVSNGGTRTEITSEAMAATVTAIEWTFTNAADGANGTLSFNVKVTEDAANYDEIANTASIQIGNDNVTTDTTTNEIPKKTVSVAGAKDDYTVEVGQELSYSISFTNTEKDADGNAAAANITVTDAIPTGTEYVDGSATYTLKNVNGGVIDVDARADITAVVKAENGVVTWTFTNVPANATGTVTFKVTVTEDALTTNEVSNSATVEIGDNGYELASNTVTNYVPEDPTKVLDPTSKGYTDTPTYDATTDTYTYGEVAVSNVIEYEIYYYNHYPEATDVTIVDVLDENVEFASATGVERSKADGTEAIIYDLVTDANGVTTVTWTIKDVPAETEGKVELHVLVLADVRTPDDVEDSVANQATVTVGDVTNDTNIVVNPVHPKNYPDDPEKNVVAGSAGENHEAVQVGDEITYGISYYNHHDTEAQVIITDTLDKGVDFVNASGTAKADATDADTVVYEVTTDADGITTVTWTIEKAAAYEAGRVTLTVKVNEKAEAIDAASAYETENGASVSNTASVKIGNGTAVDTNTYTNDIYDDPETEKTEVTVGGEAAVLKSPAEDETKTYQDVKVGEEIVYSISYKNNLNTPATVVITDTLDEGVDFVDATGKAKTDATDADTIVYEVTTDTEGITTVTWTIYDVAQFTGGSVELTVKVKAEAKTNVNADGVATVENTASVTVGNSAAVETNMVENPIEPDPEDPPVKTVYDAEAEVAAGEEAVNIDGENVAIGDTLTYEVTYYNNTNETVTVTITDALDKGVDYVDGSASDDGSYNSTERMLTWIIKEVAPFTGGSVTFDVTVNESAATNVKADGSVKTENTATVKIGNNAEVKSNTVENPIEPEPEDPPTKTISESSEAGYTNDEGTQTPVTGSDGTVTGTEVAVGDVITYEITYYNNTNKTVDVQIKDALDVGVTYSSSSHDGSYVSADHEVIWTITNVAPFTGGSVTLTVIVDDDAKEDVKDDGTAKVVNEARVTIGNSAEVSTNTVENPIEPDPEEDPIKTVYDANDYAAAEDEEKEATEISGETVYVDEELTYEISYKNNTNETVEVTITDTLDKGVVFVTASGNGTEKDGVVTWTETLKPFDTVAVTLTVKVTEDAKQTAVVENQAGVSVNNETAIDTNKVTNPVNPDDPKDPEKEITEIENKEGVVQENAETVAIGDKITYTISYYNFNNTKADVIITDVLDPGVDFYSATGVEAGTATADDAVVYEYDAVTHTVTWTIRNVEAFKPGSVTLTVVVNEKAKLDVNDDGMATVENTANVKIGNNYDKYTDPVEIPVTPDEPENPTKTISSGSEAGYYDENGNVAVETDQDGNVTGSTVGVGGIIEYVIGYYNYENTTATITITDELDPGVMFVSAEGVEVTDISTVDTETAGDSYVTYRVETTTDAVGNEVTTVIWTIFNVKPFTKGSVLLQVEVLEAAKTPAEGEDTATVENEATAENSEDPDNTYTSNVVVNEISPDDPGDPAKTVTADSEAGVDGAAVDVGEEITYAITYYNHNQTKADVTITDALDIGVEFVEAGEGGVYDAETHTVTWSITDVTAFTGGFVTVTVRVTEAALKLDPGDTMGDVENQAEVQVGDITNSTNIVVNPIAPGEPEEPTKIVDDSELTEIDEDGNYVYESVGIYDTITYEIEYYNHHNEIVIIEIIDKLDEGVDFITASGVKAENATDSDLVTWVYDEETHTVTWTIVELPWTGGTVSVTVQVNESAKLVETGEVIATVENEATVIVAPDMEHETTMNSNKVIVPIDPDQPADPSKVVVSDEGSEGSSVAVGDEVSYLITWYNNNNEAADVTIVDVLDSGVDFVEATGTEKSKATDADTVVYEVTTDADGKVTVTWTITGVAPFTAGSVELTVKVNENAKKIADDETQATVSNTASVQIGNDPAVNTNTTENPIDPDDPKDPTKTITTEGVKEGDTVEAGDVLTYEIGFYNYTNEVATVTITDALDSGVDYVSCTDGGVYDETTHTVTWTLTVDPFTEGSVSVTVKVNETAATQISNTAYVKIGNGTDSDTTTDPTDPDEPDNGTPTNTVTNPVKEEVPAPAPTEPVPTTSDTEAVVPYTVMMLMAFAAIIILLKGRRRENA